MSAPFSLGDYIYAHRGTWSPDGPPENSLAAFRAAAELGMGLELDVRLSADGCPMCFHDRALARMTGEEGDIHDQSAEALQKLCLKKTGETIPTLDELLTVWPHHLPLLIEIKAMDVAPIPAAEAVAARLLGYEGRAAAMSFNPEAVAFLPKTLPRGQLIDRVSKIGDAAFDAIMQRALTEFQVDYLSVWHKDAARARPFARDHGLGLVVWTVTSPEESAVAAPYCDAQIIEGFDPALAVQG